MPALIQMIVEAGEMEKAEPGGGSCGSNSGAGGDAVEDPGGRVSTVGGWGLMGVMGPGGGPFLPFGIVSTSAGRWVMRKADQRARALRFRRTPLPLSVLSAVSQWDWCTAAVFTCSASCGGGGGDACIAVEELVAVVNESELHTVPTGGGTGAAAAAAAAGIVL